MTGVLTLCNFKKVHFYTFNYVHVLGCVSTVPTEVEEGITCLGAGVMSCPTRLLKNEHRSFAKVALPTGPSPPLQEPVFNVLLLVWFLLLLLFCLF